MQVTRSSSADTAAGPGEWLTGRVYVDTVATPREPSRLGAASVHFTPGARTAWHTHPLEERLVVAVVEVVVVHRTADAVGKHEVVILSEISDP